MQVPLVAVFSRVLPSLCPIFAAKYTPIWRQIVKTWRQNSGLHRQGVKRTPTGHPAYTDTECIRRTHVTTRISGAGRDGAPEGLTPLVEWEWWSNFRPWLMLVQVKGAMAHPVYQVVVSVRLKVPWASHGEQFTQNK